MWSWGCHTRSPCVWRWPYNTTIMTAEVHIYNTTVVCMGVKLYQFDDAMDVARPRVGPDTTIVGWQNGVTAEDRLITHFGTAHVVGVGMGRASVPLAIGAFPHGMSARTNAIVQVFTEAGSQCGGARQCPGGHLGQMHCGLWRHCLCPGQTAGRRRGPGARLAPLSLHGRGRSPHPGQRQGPRVRARVGDQGGSAVRRHSGQQSCRASFPAARSRGGETAGAGRMERRGRQDWAGTGSPNAGQLRHVRRLETV